MSSLPLSQISLPLRLWLRPNPRLFVHHTRFIPRNPHSTSGLHFHSSTLTFILLLKSIPRPLLRRGLTVADVESFDVMSL
ncbi:unnamed protein product [Somion occarium]|uniref:Uncharacterized protein n=1 Tax=Somion occarium TaxID=3059160 RepID=A0ABP1DKM4_9APHY